MPNFWRAPVDNDIGCCMPTRYAMWKGASLYATAKNPETNIVDAPQVIENDNCVIVSYNYYIPTNPVSICNVSYIVEGDGRINVSMKYNVVHKN